MRFLLVAALCLVFLSSCSESSQPEALTYDSKLSPAEELYEANTVLREVYQLAGGGKTPFPSPEELIDTAQSEGTAAQVGASLQEVSETGVVYVIRSDDKLILAVKPQNNVYQLVADKTSLHVAPH